VKRSRLRSVSKKVRQGRAAWQVVYSQVDARSEGVHQNRFLRRRRRPRRLNADERKLVDRAHAAVLRELERARLRALE
jgi:hypothetical protein